MLYSLRHLVCLVVGSTVCFCQLLLHLWTLVGDFANVGLGWQPRQQAEGARHLEQLGQGQLGSSTGQVQRAPPCSWGWPNPTSPQNRRLRQALESGHAQRGTLGCNVEEDHSVWCIVHGGRGFQAIAAAWFYFQDVRKLGCEGVELEPLGCSASSDAYSIALHLLFRCLSTHQTERPSSFEA